MGRTPWIVSLMLALVACGGKKEDPPPNGGRPTPPPAGPGSFTKLSVTIDGKQIPMESAIAKTFADGRIQLFITPNKVVTCKELLVNKFDNMGIESVLVDLAGHLDADGKESYGVGQIYMGNPVDTDKGGTAKVSAAPAKDAAIDVDLDFTATNGRSQKIVVKGQVPVKGCGEHDPSVDTRPPAKDAKSTASITVAGKKFPVRGAVRHGDEIELVDYARDCTTAWFPGVRVIAKKTEWVLNGARIAEAVTSPITAPSTEPTGSGSAGSGATKAGSGSAAGSAMAADMVPVPNTLAIKPGKVTPGAGSGSDATLPTVTLDLSGEGMLGKYAVKLEGSVEALDCK